MILLSILFLQCLLLFTCLASDPLIGFLPRHGVGAQRSKAGKSVSNVETLPHLVTGRRQLFHSPSVPGEEHSVQQGAVSWPDPGRSTKPQRVDHYHYAL